MVVQVPGQVLRLHQALPQDLRVHCLVLADMINTDFAVDLVGVHAGGGVNGFLKRTELSAVLLDVLPQTNLLSHGPHQRLVIGGLHFRETFILLVYQSEASVTGLVKFLSGSSNE